MANPWFRLYSELANDPKIQMMSEQDQRRYIMLLCLRCSNGDVTLQDEEVAFQLRISNEEWLRTKALFVSKELIDGDNKPASWDKRQYESDSSAARVAKHREKKKQECNVTVTPPDTDTDTETDTDKNKKQRATRFDAQAHLVSLGIPSDLSADWIKLRKTKKAEVTKTAIEGIERESMKAGISLDAALRECCARGWAGFKSEWMQQGQARASPQSTGRQSRVDSYAAQAAQARGNHEQFSTGTERDITGEAERIA